MGPKTRAAVEYVGIFIVCSVVWSWGYVVGHQSGTQAGFRQGVSASIGKLADILEHKMKPNDDR